MSRPTAAAVDRDASTDRPGPRARPARPAGVRSVRPAVLARRPMRPATSPADPATPPQVIPRPPSARAGCPGRRGPPSAAAARRGPVARVLGRRPPSAGPDRAAGTAGRPWPARPPTAAARPGRRVGRAGGPLRGGRARPGWSSPGGRRRSGPTGARSAFPGGRIDPGEDAGRGAPARGGRGDRPRPGVGRRSLGWLRPVAHRSSSGSLIIPVVGVLGGRPTSWRTRHEVERVFDVALADLVAEGVFHEERWAVPGPPGARRRPTARSRSGSSRLAGEIVWGATARMLFELLVPGPRRRPTTRPPGPPAGPRTARWRDSGSAAGCRAR